jgi:hypothetical protein
MPLADQRAVEQAAIVHPYHVTERRKLDVIRRYWVGKQPLPAVLPSATPKEVKQLALMARVNICKIVVESLTQSMFVDGFRAKDDSQNHGSWRVWQANKMDARQTGIHSAAFAYRASYAVVLPGNPHPVIRGVGPRQMCVVYGEDPDWPMWALERMGRGVWRLYDDEAVYFLSEKPQMIGDPQPGHFTFLEARPHGLGVTPVVRFLDDIDLDAEDEVEGDGTALGQLNDRPTGGQIAPLMAIQDQIDFTTFGLLVAQHYSAFRQRYIIGWVTDDEAEKMKAAASTMWMFAPDQEDDESGDTEPPEIKVGEFGQTDLSGFLESREASIKYAATLSQTPVHELIGELVNLSAEALAAVEAGRDRKVDARQTLMGESHEQVLWLAGRASKPRIEIPEDAQVQWRDTSARAFAAIVDGLGKLVTMLGIPPQELWSKVPGATRQDVESWKAAAEQGDAYKVLADMLERQSGIENPGTTVSGGGVVLPAGAAA